MKLYRARVAPIAAATLKALLDDGDIEVNNREEAEKDLVAIMGEYLRRDDELRTRVKDQMARKNLPYGEGGKVRKALAEEMEHPVGDDVFRFLSRQFVENLMISRFVDEVFAEDAVLYKKVMEVLKSFDVDEDALRTEAAEKVKNVQQGTVEYEIALSDAMRDVKKRKGLLDR
jgi:hypothetical protein